MQFTVLTTTILALAAGSQAILHKHHPRNLLKRGSYEDDAVNAHNAVRSQYNANPLTWSNDLANSAAQAAGTCTFAHQMPDNGEQDGQNLMEGSNDIASTVNSWASEVQSYVWFNQEPDHSYFGSFGHFTQVVWKDTTSVGCATQQCDNGPLTVCNYFPAGNVDGQYAANV